ncbi:hypothetical protein [Rhodoflexus caldus]|uniref:hypothetical protein n=1 Tax=Rhodoflexus caldus TaxID=2891236 RepID=UPI00202A8BDF|nr:hypothetical protein [Rhodoflexus caldus]
MAQFTRFVLLVGFLIVFVVIYYASANGFGVSGLNDKKISAEMKGDRGGSYFMSTGRSVRGGGMRYGK